MKTWTWDQFGLKKIILTNAFVIPSSKDEHKYFLIYKDNDNSFPYKIATHITFYNTHIYFCVAFLDL